MVVNYKPLIFTLSNQINHNKMITITVQVSKDCKETAIITVKEALCWSSGRPYTLEDYAIFAEIEKDRAQNIQPKLD